MKMTKRLLSAALSLCLAAGLAPWTVTPAKAEAQTYTDFTADGGNDYSETDGYACLVDGDPATQWFSNNKSTPPDGPGSCLWVDFHADRPIYVDRYTLTNSDDAACDPSAWVLKSPERSEGSDRFCEGQRPELYRHRRTGKCHADRRSVRRRQTDGCTGRSRQRRHQRKADNERRWS